MELSNGAVLKICGFLPRREFCAAQPLRVIIVDLREIIVVA